MIVEEGMPQGIKVRPLDSHETDDAETEHPIVPSGRGSQSIHKSDVREDQKYNANHHCIKRLTTLLHREYGSSQHHT